MRGEAETGDSWEAYGLIKQKQTSLKTYKPDWASSNIECKDQPEGVFWTLNMNGDVCIPAFIDKGINAGTHTHTHHIHT